VSLQEADDVLTIAIGVLRKKILVPCAGDDP